MTKESLSGVAIISMVGCFPGASDVRKLWELVRDGSEGISSFTAAELIESGISPKLVNNPNYVRARGIIPDIERFDARFFGYSPREAELLDPQQRLFLEYSWAALEAASYTSTNAGATIGIFGGSMGGSTYLTSNLLGNQELRDNVGDYQIFLANEKDGLTTRVAYKLNLRGPAVTVQTGCSTSLVAVAMACQSLIDFQCDMALAGGVAITVPQKIGYLYTPGLIISPDGHCRPFDANAKGTLTSSGIGVVLLKRLEDAIRDRDSITAVIRGWAVNNDGSDKVGYTAPSTQGQADCITQALALADVDPGSIGMVEAHGTGTPVGDPIEVAALTKAFHTSTKRKGFCALGSVKSNLGHLETAAGITGLIKTAQALEHGQIPPSLHYETPNPEIDFENSPFYVNTKLRPWPAELMPRRAGVSSLGVGGTNAHVVLEQAPPAPATDPGRPWKLLVLSARTRSALDTATENLQRHLAQYPELDLADAAYSLQIGRRNFSQRRMVLCSDRTEALALLGSGDPQRILTSEAESQPGLIFMFSGQGSQYVNMARELYEREQSFREQVDFCCEQLRSYLNLDLRTILYPPDAQREQATGQLTQTALTQPALFVIEYALAKLWMKLGLKPVAMIGHSIGEYVAACLAGVMSLRDALMLVAQRGALMQQMPAGAMLAVPVSEDRVRPLLNAELSLSVINGPSHCVVAGRPEAIDALQKQLSTQGLRGRRLQTSHAFHSAMMDPILAPFTDKVRRVRLSPPQIRYISNVTGRWITPQEATDPNYYARQLRSPVRFSPGLELLLSEPDRVLLEVGPGATLSILARQHPDPNAKRVVLSSLRGADGTQSDTQCFLAALGRLWLAGCPVTWEALYQNERRRRVALPTYPFERERFWIEPVRKSADIKAAAAPTPTPKVAELDSYFYRPSWRSSPPPPAFPIRGQQSWLLLANKHPLCACIARRLRQQGHHVTTVYAGEGFTHDHLDEYTIQPSLLDHYGHVLAELHRQGRSPRRIVHLWNIGGPAAGLLPSDASAAQELSYFSLTTLAQALGQQLQTEPVSLAVATTGALRVGAEDLVEHPERALVSGPCKVIPAEYRNISCQHIDLQLPAPGVLDEDMLAERLITEFSAAKPEPVLAYRGLQRFILQYTVMRLPRPAGDLPRLRYGGTYLITGGLGGIGLALAEFLARSYHAKLLLTSRHGLPQHSELAQAAAAMINSEEMAKIDRTRQQLETLRRLGGEVMVAQADVSDLEAMQAAVDEAVARFGPIRGVIHAAGVPGGGVIQRRSREAAETVLAPKVKGTLVLDTIFKKRDLDFFVLCSSLNAVLGGFGQADYSAANAFLDAFAHHRTAKSRGLTASINWDAWREVGMALDSARQRSAIAPPASQQPTGSSQYRELAHPLFSRFMLSQKGEEIYITRFSGRLSWLLQEHRVKGRPTLPGTAHLELARAAYEMHLSSVCPMELRDVALLSPLAVTEGREREVRTILQPLSDGTGCEFKVVSRLDDDSGDWQEHARGRIAPLSPSPAIRHDIERLLRETPMIFTEHPSGARPRLIKFGPRWQNLSQIRFGRSQGLAFIELPETFQDDLDVFMLHPALLDSATSFAAVRSATHYLPFSYRRIRVFQRLPKSFYSYAAFEQNSEGGRERMQINLTVMDLSGTVILEVEDYVLVKVST